MAASEKQSWLVKDFMRTSVVTVNIDATMKEALEVMIRERTNGVVVVDNNRKVVGILSSWDIIQHIVPDYLEEDKHLASFEAGDMFVERAHQLKDDPITKFMTKDVHTVRAGHTIMAAAALLSTFHIRQLPVVDNDGNLVGYLNRTDIKLAVGKALELEDPRSLSG